MQKPVIIFGTSTLGQSVDLYLTRDSTREVVAYSASSEAIARLSLTTVNGKPVVPFEEVEKIYPPEHYDMFVAVGYAKMNRTKEEIITKAEEKGYTLISHMCSSVTHWGDVVMGPNVFVFDNNNIQPNVKLGKGIILGRGSNIGHDSVIEDYAFLANHVVLCGYNVVGKFCFVGSNATIADGIKLAPRTLVGATAFVKRDTMEGDAFVAPETPKSHKKSDAFFDW